MCLSDGSSQQLVQNFIRFTRSYKLQIDYGNEELDTILSQVNTSQNLQQTIGNTYSGFHSLSWIITERLIISLKNKLNNYIREETNEERKKR